MTNRLPGTHIGDAILNEIARRERAKTRRSPLALTESGFDLSNHYDCPLSVLGLSAESTVDEIDAAVENELADLDDNYDDHGVTSTELLEFIEAWVEDVRRKT